MVDPPSAPLLGKLLALMAHDLRNPLSALQSNVSYLTVTREEANPDEREALADAVASCDSLAFLVDGLELIGLQLATPDPRPTEPVAVSLLVGEVLARHQILASSHGVKLAVEESLQEASLRVRVHRDLYGSALAHLVRNGIQHSHSGGVVRVLGHRDAAHWVLVLADDGTRLGEEFAVTAFLPEGQLAAKGRAQGRYGRGLGLYCAGLAARLAGATVASCLPPASTNNAFELRAPWVDG
jgi:signal transduction histidine kinase